MLCNPISNSEPPKVPHWPQHNARLLPPEAVEHSPQPSLLPTHPSPPSSNHMVFSSHRLILLCATTRPLHMLSHMLGHWFLPPYLLGLCFPFSSQLGIFQESLLSSPTTSTLLPFQALKSPWTCQSQTDISEGD